MKLILELFQQSTVPFTILPLNRTDYSEQTSECTHYGDAPRSEVLNLPEVFGTHGGLRKGRQSMKKLAAIVTLAIFSLTFTSSAATCTGASDCKACKDCDSYKHCKKDAGSCAACKNK